MRQRTHRIGLFVSIVILLSATNCSNTPADIATTPPLKPSPQTDVPTPTQTVVPPATQADILAPTPPMGWNSFNHFGCDIDEKLVMETADAMVSSGMAALGYEFVNIDDCWMAPARDSDGNLQGDPQKFPHGMKVVADYIHTKGLKLGLYLDRGTKTCAGYPGSYGYEIQDANQMASWEVDYVKYDNCSPVGKLLDDYTNMHNALVATGRPIVFSMCSWGFPGILVARLDIAQLWRTSSDIRDSWERMINIGEANNAYAPFAEPGHWNDPDMLEVGNGGMTETEYRTHFSLWAMMAAPLIAGNDLRTMDQATKDILTAPEVIAVDQDPLGVQGTLLSDPVSKRGLEVWSKPLSTPNTYAVMFLNRSEHAGSILVHWSDLGLPAGAARVRDLWARTDVGIFYNGYGNLVPSHGVVLVKVTSVSLPTPKTIPPQ